MTEMSLSQPLGGGGRWEKGGLGEVFGQGRGISPLTLKGVDLSAQTEPCGFWNTDLNSNCFIPKFRREKNGLCTLDTSVRKNITRVGVG